MDKKEKARPQGLPNGQWEDVIDESAPIWIGWPEKGDNTEAEVIGTLLEIDESEEPTWADFGVLEWVNVGAHRGSQEERHEIDLRVDLRVRIGFTKLLRARIKRENLGLPHRVRFLGWQTPRAGGNPFRGFKVQVQKAGVTH